MPRLHNYRERCACYVLTAIRGAVITYQLTPDGERKVTAAGHLETLTRRLRTWGIPVNYQQLLIQIAVQLRRADREFRNTATRLLELLSTQVVKVQ